MNCIRIRAATLAAALALSTPLLAQGSDGCGTPQAISGAGPFTFDSVTATTGAEGQVEASCAFLGSTAINGDVWFSWVSTGGGTATVSLCGGTTLDTKLAVYDGSGCPTGGALACDDNSCGSQSSVSFTATAGSTYTIQLGASPSTPVSGGTGTFTIQVAPTVVAHGLAHTATGGATLQVIPSGGILVVANIGSSGNDGVAIDLPSSTWGTKWDLVTVPGVPQVIELEPQGTYGGGPQQVLAKGRSEKIGATWFTSADHSYVGHPTYRLLVLDQGHLVASVSGVNGLAAETDLPPTGGGSGRIRNPGTGPGGTNCDPWETTQWYCAVGPPYVQCGASWSTPSPALTSCCSGAGGSLVATCGIPSLVHFNWPIATPITVNGVTYVGDQVVFEDDNPPASADALTDGLLILRYLFGLTGSALTTSLTLTNEWFEAFGNRHEVMTLANVHMTNGQLTIQSSRDQDICTTLNRSESAFFALAPLNPLGTAPLGSFMECEARGSLNGTLDQSLGTVRWTLMGCCPVEDICMVADFAPIGSPTQRVVVLNGGVVLADIPGHSGPVGLSSWPRRIGKLGGTTDCIVSEYIAGNTAIVAGTTYIADEVRMLAEAPASTSIDYKSLFALHAWGIDQFTILDEDVEVAAVPGTSYCSGDGSLPTACPCGNLGGTGRGCRNSVNPSGAALVATGFTETDAVSGTDTVVLRGSGMPATSSAIYIKGNGTNAAGVVLGDGILCLTGSLIRLRTKFNVGGASQFPETGDLSVSVRGMTPHGSGLTGYYQVYYRNAASFCTAATFNVSNGMRIEW